MEIVLIYLRIPIGFNGFWNAKHGQAALASMMEHARDVSRSKLSIAEKMHAFKAFVFPRIDYRMM
jgi:hypothetical protein